MLNNHARYQSCMVDISQLLLLLWLLICKYFDLVFFRYNNMLLTIVLSYNI